MREPSWVHERPASTSFRDLTVVTQKSASPALKTEGFIIFQMKTKQETGAQKRQFYELATKQENRKRSLNSLKMLYLTN